jgi:hypothetical protein
MTASLQSIRITHRRAERSFVVSFAREGPIFLKSRIALGDVASVNAADAGNRRGSVKDAQRACGVPMGVPKVGHRRAESAGGGLSASALSTDERGGRWAREAIHSHQT